MSASQFNPQFTDGAALAALTEVARGVPRRRRNANFHKSESEPANRLLNAIEPGSYIRPHRHLDPNKDETMVVLKGSLGMLWFDDAGAVAGQAVMAPGGTCVVNIPHGCWHTLLALEPGTVFFEAKGGPYAPLAADETAGWAPPEGDAAVPGYYASLLARFR